MSERHDGWIDPPAAERPLALALDVGSSSVRAFVYDRLGRLVRECGVQLAYRMQTTPAGGVFVPVAELRGRVEQALDEICDQGGRLMEDVRAVGWAAFSHSLVGLDADGLPVTPVLSWADSTSAAAADELLAELDGEATWQRTGAPIHASYWPARIRHHRSRASGVMRWSGFAELLAEWLTGRRVASISIASSSGLLDRRRDRWDETLLAALGIEPADLPTLVADSEPLGTLLAERRRRWPGLAGAQWFPAWADGACGNVGLGCHGPDRAALMIGTSSAMRVLLDRRDVDTAAGLFCFRLGQHGSLLGGQLSEGGGTAAWIGRMTGLPLSELDQLAEPIQPVGHSLVMLPYLTGERAPGYHARAKASIHGLSLGSGPAEMFRAALEAVAVGLALVDRRLSSAIGTEPNVVAAGGAVARSRLWPQILADALGRPVELPLNASEPSARGAALMALDYAGTNPAHEAPLLSARWIEPDLRRHPLYRDLLERRLRLYDRAVSDWD